MERFGGRKVSRHRHLADRLGGRCAGVGWNLGALPTRVLRTPNGAIFSKSTNSVRAPITARFITLSANSNSIKTQQQPRQENPVLRTVAERSKYPCGPATRAGWRRAARRQTHSLKWQELI